MELVLIIVSPNLNSVGQFYVMKQVVVFPNLQDIVEILCGGDW